MNKQDTKKIMFLQTIWFTFLVVSLVACFFACIIFGINSKNVAHAEGEEPTRVVGNTGFVENNCFDTSYALDWSYSETVPANTPFYVATGESCECYVICENASFTVSNNTISSTDSLRFVINIKDYTKLYHYAVGYYSFIIYKSSTSSCSWSTSNINCYSYNSGTWSLVGSVTNSSSNCFLRGYINYAITSNGLRMSTLFNGGGTISISGFGLYNSNSNVPYVPPTYMYYGYNNGVANGGGASDEELEAAYDEGYDDGYDEGYDDGYAQGLEDGEEVILPVDSYNLVGSIMTLGKVSGEFIFNGNSYNAYVGETDSFTDTSGVLYQGQYYDTQGDSDVLLGFCVNYLFKYSVKVRTICYGSESRWNRVGFNIIAIDTVDNSSYVLSRSDTTYYSEFGSLGADGTNGTYVSAEFSFSFPNNHEYRLLFVPINHSLNESRSISDGASMLIFEDTYFLTQAQGSLSYDDYNALISDAYDRGMIQGRTNGYDSGYSSGYSVGYNTGTDDAGNYTFASLLGAVFDAPITAIVGKYDSVSGTRIGGLLNFNVLGVNISGFVLALLSIGVVLFILRIFLRGV